jgi:hypothetical protein
MKTSVQARLDEESAAALEDLQRRLGLSSSEIVREGIRLVQKRHAAAPRRKLIGIGKYDSGIPDLATNKKHMEGFGASSMGKGWRSPDGSARD